jgi:hypothetical protein
MKTKLNILTLGLLWIFCACNVSTTRDKKTVLSKNDTIKGVLTIKEGSFKIDTLVILTHQNLDPLLRDLEKTDLKTFRQVRDIPVFLINFLKVITKDSFSIANPNEDWQVGCNVTDGLPSRQLIYFGLAENIALLTYLTGGIGESEHILIIKFSSEKITDFWCGNIMANLTNKEEILKYIKENRDKKWGLGTNIIYL